MNLTIKGKNIDVGEALRTHVAQALDHSIAKYFGNPIEATVTFSKQSHLFSADMSVHIGRGILMQAEASADQAYAAFDQAIDHLAKRLRRYKRRLRDHHRVGDGKFPRGAIHPGAGIGRRGRARPPSMAARRLP